MSELNELAKYQRDLKLTAAGVLLHNLGKVSRQFLEKQLGSGSNDFLYQHILGLISSYRSTMPSGLWDGYKKLPSSDILEPHTKAALTANSICLPFPFNDRSYVPGEMIEFLGEGGSEPWYKKDQSGKFGIFHLYPGGSRLTHLVNRAHHGASGGEKEGIWKPKHLKENCLFLATPFGWETSAPGICNIDDLRLKIERIIQSYLSCSEAPFSFRQFAQSLYPYLNQAIADTRRPVNDVTVWDIGHTAAAFYVTQAVGRILTNSPLEHDDLVRIEENNSLFWRVLSVRTNGLRYLEGAATLADLRVRKSRLEQALERIQFALEECPIAVQVYRDENGSFYIFPEFENRSESLLMAVKSDLFSLVEIDGRTLDVDLSPECLVNHPKDQGGKYIGDFIQEELRKDLVDNCNPISIARAWMTPSNNAEICSACGIRPQGYGAKLIPSYCENPDYYSNKAKLRNLCCLCMKWRSGVAEKWIYRIKQGVNVGTVWIDEVADDRGKVALIAGQLPFEHFSGTVAYPHESSKRVEEWKWRHSVKWIGESPDADYNFSNLHNGRSYIWDGSTLNGEDELRPFKQGNLRSNSDSLSLVSIRSSELGDLFLEVKENISSKLGMSIPIWGESFEVVNANSMKAISSSAVEKVKRQMLWNDGEYSFFIENCRKVEVIKTNGLGVNNKSFARLRRIWETTRNFWQEVCPTNEDGTLAQSLISAEIGHVGPRLVINPKHADNLDFAAYHAYDMVLSERAKLSVIWDSECKCFVTCDNLDYLANKDQLGQKVLDFLRSGTAKTIEEPTGYGSKKRVLGMIEIEEVSEVPDSTYTPVIPILAEPRTFMALVPAEKALNMACAIKTKYEREMGKVRNRLPLNLGIVYAGRRTPLRAILDAGRRMLDRSLPPEDWKIVSVEQKSIDKRDFLPERFKGDKMRQFHEWLEILLEKNGRHITWRIPAMMGDGTTTDQWYPYAFLNTGSEPANRNRHFSALNPLTNEDGWLVHAGDLKAGDLVYFTPATLDFQWLDNAGRRFEIAYNGEGERRGLPRRPYTLDELDTLNEIWKTMEKYLTKNQIYILRDLIEAKRIDWQITDPSSGDDSVFRKFCCDAVASADWGKGKESGSLGKPWESDGKDRDSWLAQWANYAAWGWITDVVELHLQIMKEEVNNEF